MTNIPTIQQLQNSIISDIETQYGVTIPSYGQSVLRVLAFVWAGKLRLQYLYNGFIQRQLFPDVADVESQGGPLIALCRMLCTNAPIDWLACFVGVAMKRLRLKAFGDNTRG